jgi:hypothetical protein
MHRGVRVRIKESLVTLTVGDRHALLGSIRLTPMIASRYWPLESSLRVPVWMPTPAATCTHDRGSAAQRLHVRKLFDHNADNSASIARLCPRGHCAANI